MDTCHYQGKIVVSFQINARDKTRAQKKGKSKHKLTSNVHQNEDQQSHSVVTDGKKHN